MRQLLLIINLFVWTHLMYSQSIALKGYVYEYPDTTSAETLKPARGIWISHPKAKPTLTDSQGRFTLYFSEVAEGERVDIRIVPLGKYKDYVLLAPDEVRNVVLGSHHELRIPITPQRLQRTRQATLTDNSLTSYQSYVKVRLRQLNDRLDSLSKRQDEHSQFYKATLDSLQILTEQQPLTIKRLRHYAREQAKYPYPMDGVSHHHI